jgi:hypothetical protein
LKSENTNETTDHQKRLNLLRHGKNTATPTTDSKKQTAKPHSPQCTQSTQSKDFLESENTTKTTDHQKRLNLLELPGFLRVNTASKKFNPLTLPSPASGRGTDTTRFKE